MTCRMNISNYKGVKCKLKLLACTFLIGLLFVGPNAQSATQVEIDASRVNVIAWLITSQKGDGSWRGTEGSTIQSTSAAVQALYNAGVTDFSYSRGLGWLANTEALNVDALSRQIIAMSNAGMDTQEKLETLLAWRNRESSWGAYDKYSTSFPDTSLASSAIRSDSITFATETNDLLNAICEIVEAQKTGNASTAGSWSYTPALNTSLASSASGAVLPTAYNLLEISAYVDLGYTSRNCDGTIYDFNTVINSGVNWLLTQRLNIADGSFGDDGVSSVLDTALAYLAISEIAPSDPSLMTAQDFIINTQSTNGSWSDDVLVSAIVATTFPSAVLTDTDDDGLPDAVELNLGTDPTVDDSRFFAGYDTDPNYIDADRDGLSDVIDPDDDNDGINDIDDAFPYDSTLAGDHDSDGVDSVIDDDDDNDGMPDTFESLYGLNPLDAADANLDLDNDGLTNLEEYLKNTNPLMDDTDGDGFIDSVDDLPNDPTENLDTDMDTIGNNVDPDDDNDGMPDSFETQYGLNSLDASDANSDIDSDNDSALAEFHAGTDPTNIDSNSYGVPYVHYKLLASDGQASDLLGSSVAIDGDRALVGAFAEDGDGSSLGAVYVYTNDGVGNWTQQDKLTAQDAASFDRFGYSVALSGTTALIGAYGDDDGGSLSGSAYIFTDDGTGVWIQRDKLTAPDAAASDLFGYSVALSGATALIGAHGNDDGDSSTGSAYVFTDDGTGAWSYQDKLTAPDAAASDLFGYSVALSNSTALIGAYRDDDDGTSSGSAYVFTDDGAGAWSYQDKLTAPDAAASDLFGYSVALSSSTALIGAYGDDDGGTSSGSAYVFTDDGTGAWSYQDKLTAPDAAASDLFGYSVALSSSAALIGAYGDDDGATSSGSAYVFVDDGTGAWSYQVKLSAVDAAYNNSFGKSVAISDTAILVGANNDDDNGSNSGSAYMFELDADSDGIWNLDDLDDDGDGLSDADENSIYNTNPLVVDTDSDGMPDGWEVQYGLNPLVDDGDVDADNDGVTNVEEYLAGTDPLIPQITADGDINNDGVVNVVDVLLAQRVLLGTLNPTAEQLMHADVAPLVNGEPVPDGIFNAGDLVVIQRKALGLISF